MVSCGHAHLMKLPAGETLGTCEEVVKTEGSLSLSQWPEEKRLNFVAIPAPHLAPEPLRSNSRILSTSAIRTRGETLQLESHDWRPWRSTVHTLNYRPPLSWGTVRWQCPHENLKWS